MQDLPQDVRDFLDAHIFTASQLEVLLLLRASGDQRRSLGDLSRETALPQSSLGPWLDAFVSRGLLERDGGGYWCAPASAEVRAVLDRVAEVWARRKTTVTRYIYASTQDPLVRFADAFRFRRQDGGAVRDRDEGPERGG